MVLVIMDECLEAVPVHRLHPGPTAPTWICSHAGHQFRHPAPPNAPCTCPSTTKHSKRTRFKGGHIGLQHAPCPVCDLPSNIARDHQEALGKERQGLVMPQGLNMACGAWAAQGVLCCTLTAALQQQGPSHHRRRICVSISRSKLSPAGYALSADAASAAASFLFALRISTTLGGGPPP